MIKKTMSGIGESVLDLLGNTPLVRLNRVSAGSKATIAAKLESHNPAGSVKDRIALSMITEAERAGIIDGTDNFAAKFLINDACVLSGKPFSHAGILRFQGQTMTVLPGQTTCYRCVFDAPPPQGLVPTCSQAGILGAVAGVIGSLQAVECLKYLLGIGQLLTDCLLTFDALTMAPRRVTFRPNSCCPVCGQNPTITEVRDEVGAQVTCDLRK